MKTKKYLLIKVVKYDGSIFYNPLKLSEVIMINLLVRENNFITVTLKETTEENYKSIFE